MNKICILSWLVSVRSYREIEKCQSFVENELYYFPDHVIQM